MRYCVPLFVALCAVGCQPAPQASAPSKDSAAPQKEAPAATAAPTDGGGLAAKDGSFTITLPTGWGPMMGDSAEAKAMKEKVAKSKPGMAAQMEGMAGVPAVLFIGLDGSKLDDKSDFVDNVNVNVQDSGQSEWQESSVAEVTKILKEGLSDPALEAKLVDVGGKKVLRYKATMKLGAASYQILGYQYLHNKKVYTVTVSCGADKLAEREKGFDAIASSLKFKA
ncbi:MAG: hypothetical protein KF857_04155 [Fimbriimonadaceae bacterium]|nr:hypothetical protein [Fimbriimonadaceae bacterium]